MKHGIRMGVGLLFVAAVTVLSGSGAVAQAVTLTYWSHRHEPREAVDREIIAQFERAHPGVRVEYVIGPSDTAQYVTKLFTAMAGGRGPDLFNLVTLLAPALVAQGAVAPVDPVAFGVASEASLKELYLPGTLGGVEFGGRIYGVPTEVSTYSLYYNEDNFRRVGLAAFAADTPPTWDEVVAASHKLLRRQGSRLVQRGFEFAYGQPGDLTRPAFVLAGMARQLGGDVLLGNGTGSGVAAQPWVDVLTFWGDFVHQKGLGDPSLPPADLAFSDGSVSMVLSGPWYLRWLETQNNAIAKATRVAPFPRFRNAVNWNGAYLYGYALFVNATAPKESQKLAWELAAALSAQPDAYLTRAGLLQPRVSLTLSESYRTNPVLRTFVQDMVETPYWPAHPKAAELIRSLERAMQRVVMEKAHPATSLAQARTEMDALLK